MITAICFEVAAEAGIEPIDLLPLKQRAAALRVSYDAAVAAERAAIRQYEELGPRQECPSCINTPDGRHSFLCGRHGRALGRVKIAAAARIAKQRALGEAEYALDRARRGLR